MKQALKFILIGIFVIGFLAPFGHSAQFDIDPEHSSVSFKIRHLLSKTQGQFNEFSGTIQYEAGKPELWKVDAVIKADSIDTNVEARDTHLKSADFFETETYPELTFKSTRIEDATEESAKLFGTLTLHGVSKEVMLDLEILGVAEDAWGTTRAAFSATTTINRKDFGLEWNEKLETGKLLVGEEVKITLEIEGTLSK